MRSVRSVDEQLGVIFHDLQPLRAISVPLLDASGCYVAADLRVGDHVVLAAGELVSTRQLARLASAGVTAVEVAPRPRVVVMSLGDEAIDGPTSQSRANALVVASACQDAGAVVYRVGPAPRESRELTELIEDQLVRADVVVVVGGSDLAADDQVIEVLSAFAVTPSEEQSGRGVEFVEISMSPGGRLGFGRIGDDAIPVVVLPGDVLASYVSFEVFVRPLLRALAADPRPFRPTIRAEVITGWTSPSGRQEFRCGQLERVDGQAQFTPSTADEPLTVLAETTALASIPQRNVNIGVGVTALVIPLDGVSRG